VRLADALQALSALGAVLITLAGFKTQARLRIHADLMRLTVDLAADGDAPLIDAALLRLAVRHAQALPLLQGLTALRYTDPASLSARIPTGWALARCAAPLAFVTPVARGALRVLSAREAELIHRVHGAARQEHER